MLFKGREELEDILKDNVDNKNNENNNEWQCCHNQSIHSPISARVIK